MLIYIDDSIKLYQGSGGITTVFNALEKVLSNFDNVTVRKIKIKRNKFNRILYKISPFVFYFERERHIYLSSFYLTSLNPKSVNVVIVHDLMDELFNRNFRALVHIWQKFCSYYFAKGYVAVSHNTRKDLLKIYPFMGKKKGTVIYNPLRFQPLEYVKKEAKVYTKAIYIGGRGSMKGFRLVVELLKIDHRIKLSIVGKPLSIVESRLLHNFMGRIKVYNDVSDNQLRELILESDFLFYPSLYEGFGLPPLEAFSLGIPSLVSNISSCRELYRNEMFANFDPREIKELILAYENLGKENWKKRNLFLNNFKVEKFGHSYINFFRSCLT